MSRTKMTPTSPKPGSGATSRSVDTPKGSKARIPVPLVTVDADAGSLALTREAGAALVRLVRDESWRINDLARDARNVLADRVERALGKSSAHYASVLTDIAVRYVISSLTAEAVLVLVQSRPDVVLEMERLVAASRPAEV